MIKNQQERQAWHDLLKDRNREPNAEAVEMDGRLWAKVRRLICPCCRDIFYGWQSLDQPLPEGEQPDTYRFGEGARLTCGHPLCIESELLHQNRKVQAKWLASQAAGPETPTGVMR